VVSFLCNFAQVSWFVFSIKNAFDTFESVVSNVAIANSDVDAERLGADIIIDRFSELAPACRRLLAAHP
jgi:hypothetical protein